MKQELHFCKSWFRAKKRPTEVRTREWAAQAHDARQLYSVLVGPENNPSCFLEINGKFVGVGFFDDQLRETLYYAFKEVEPGKLFLSTATWRSYEKDSDKVVSGTTYVFGRDGTVKIQKQQYSPHEASTAETRIDVEANYSAWPKFGEYGDLIRVERSA